MLIYFRELEAKNSGYRSEYPFKNTVPIIIYYDHFLLSNHVPLLTVGKGDYFCQLHFPWQKYVIDSADSFIKTAEE